MVTTELRTYDDAGRPRSVTARLTRVNDCDCVSIGGVDVELPAFLEVCRVTATKSNRRRLGPDCNAFPSALRAAAVRLGLEVAP